jgi:uncharacterized protein (DUF1330 family)
VPPDESAAIEPTASQLERLAASEDSGPVVMVNLLRFRERVASDQDGTGADAYGRYAAEVTQHLDRVGGRVLLALAPQDSVIGPEHGEWDLVVAVEYPSRAAFLAMIADPDYLKLHAHRAAALADSRLIACGQLEALGD